MRSFKVKTGRKTEIVNISSDVEKLSHISEGAIVVHLMHTTAALIVNEDEANLRKDMERYYPSMAKGDFAHNTIDNNAESHLAAGCLGNSVTIPVSEGKLALGSWQSILLVELDGPRERTVTVTEVGR